MRTRLRGDEGMALLTAILVLTALIALGLGSMQFADGQQRALRTERTRESSFDQSEAVLNAQVFQLARTWPSASAPATATCTPATSGATTTCPDPNGLSATFTTADYTTPAPGCALPLWKTQVQDDDPAYGGTQYYDAAHMASAPTPAYDANGNNSVWVRATAAPQCHVQSVVALATRALTPIDWPRSVITADWFQTGNNGNKVIVNTAGPVSGQPGGVSLRCNGHTGTSCKNYRPGQVAPDTIPKSPPGGTPVLNADQIASMRTQAQGTSTYYSGCPSSVNVAGLAAGTVVFVQGGPTCSTSASGNAASNPVIFLIYDGSFSLGGNSKFYGLVYDVNASNSSASLVNLGGCAHIQGMVAVDGLGGVNVGQCKQNLVFDPTIMGSLRTYAGAVVAKNSFRVLPANAP